MGFLKKIAQSGFAKRTKKVSKLFNKADKFIMNHGDDFLKGVGKAGEMIGGLTGHPEISIISKGSEKGGNLLGKYKDTREKLVDAKNKVSAIRDQLTKNNVKPGPISNQDQYLKLYKF